MLGLRPVVRLSFLCGLVALTSVFVDWPQRRSPVLQVCLGVRPLLAQLKLVERRTYRVTLLVEISRDGQLWRPLLLLVLPLQDLLR